MYKPLQSFSSCSNSTVTYYRHLDKIDYKKKKKHTVVVSQWLVLFRIEEVPEILETHLTGCSIPYAAAR